MLNPNVFNVEKSDYQDAESLFLGQSNGLFDTVNRRHPKIWELYKTMKSLDWDELEFDFTSCNVEFKTRPLSITDRMIKTLALQWEADSVAAHSLLPVMAPFISSPELQAAWGRVTDNEVLHASTYSEIVRSSFDNPNEVLSEVLQVRESLSRLKAVTDVLGHTYRISHELALGIRSKDDPEVYDAAMMYCVAMLAMERIQFMASFAVTFAIGEIGAFMPIAKAVQKICQDEFEVHQLIHKEVLTHEFKLAIGKAFFARSRERIKKLIDEVVEAELTWVDFLLGSGDALVGLNTKLLKQWVLYSAADVYAFFGLKANHPLPKTNPIPFMENWINISKAQPSPQEQQNGQYKVNVMARTDEGKTFAVDF